MFNFVCGSTDASNDAASPEFQQIVKTSSVSHLGNFKEAATRCCPTEIVKSGSAPIAAAPVIDRICNSQIEEVHVLFTERLFDQGSPAQNSTCRDSLFPPIHFNCGFKG